MSVIAGVAKAAAGAKVLTGTRPTTRVFPPAKWTLVHTLFRGTLEEAEAVARAGGTELPEDFVEQALATAAAVEPWGRSSLYHELAYGGRVELEALNGEVVRRRRVYDIQTPLNVAI
jgi:ketopantoate reductase